MPTPQLDTSQVLRWLLWLLILASGALFLWGAGPELNRIFGIKEFVSNPIVSIFALTVLAFGFHYKFRDSGYEFIAEGLIVGATVGLLLEVTHIRKLFLADLTQAVKTLMTTPALDLKGEWTYEAKDLSGKVLQKGDATIEQPSENTVAIQGKRRPQDWDWSTKFGVIHDVSGVKKLSFVYTILTEKGTSEGYCQLNMGFDKRMTERVNKLSGEYEREQGELSPEERMTVRVNNLSGEYKQLAPDVLQGHISFERQDDTDGTGNSQALQGPVTESLDGNSAKGETPQ